MRPYHCIYCRGFIEISCQGQGGLVVKSLQTPVQTIMASTLFRLSSGKRMCPLGLVCVPVLFLFCVCLCVPSSGSYDLPAALCVRCVSLLYQRFWSVSRIPFNSQISYLYPWFLWNFISSFKLLARLLRLSQLAVVLSLGWLSVWDLCLLLLRCPWVRLSRRALY